jgi:hypothetical protein
MITINLASADFWWGYGFATVVYVLVILFMIARTK